MLEDGSYFPGLSCGAAGEAVGEICFNTSMVGYLEVISDPSYAGQIVTMTYPQIGNYGVALNDLQCDKLALSGLVVRDICAMPSNFRSDMPLPEFLAEQGVVAITDVDTRALTRHIRDHGAQRALISSVDLDPVSLYARVQAVPELIGKNLAATVSVDAPYLYDVAPVAQAYDAWLKPAAKPQHKVIAYDCGIKRGILMNLARAGCAVIVVPWNTPAADVLAWDPDAIFLSNGPGDPEPVRETFEAVRALLGKLPVFGICMGHQMLSLAAGAVVEKLSFGHHGANQPVMNLLTRTVEVTAQNHGFSVRFDSLGPVLPEFSGGVGEHTEGSDLRPWVERGLTPVVMNPQFGRIQLTHVNLNDGTIEGLRFLDIPAFSVQYHPEASPGPTDSHYLFTAFTRLIEGRQNYLDIDISADRLREWR
ncbi:MAG: glutamine-hydrolyzing carbamoyl-phosphate synthase small subunit [Actinomycetia bacterium]|nr:glutamine-hydrolyzing carbamoyl-phosphate synthase small subunit [Actinomycetes bacterium]